MAEEFHAGICGGNWWNPSKTIFMGCSSPYSVGISDMGSLGWAADMTDIKMKPSFEESNDSVSDHNSILPQNVKPQQMIDSTLQMMGFGLSSLSTSDWNQSLLADSGLGNFRPETVMDLSPKSYITSPGEDSVSISTNFKPIDNISLNSIKSTALLQTLFEAEPQSEQLLFNDRPINYMSAAATYGGTNCNELSSPWPNVAPPPKQLQQPGLHFSNNTAFWNASARSGVNNVNTNYLRETTKTNSDDARNSGKKGSSEHPLKRPRIETPSQLPTFKVRKEKLGDRITALQQLVSPFGKTDTASVLHEAIDYIKFLHDQVNVLSTPYMKQAATSIQQQSSEKTKEAKTEGSKRDLRSRGLCLLPISSTFPVTNETTADFWTPTFGATFR